MAAVVKTREDFSGAGELIVETGIPSVCSPTGL